MADELAVYDPIIEEGDAHVETQQEKAYRQLDDIHRVITKVDELVSAISPDDVAKVANSPIMGMLGGLGGMFGKR